MGDIGFREVAIAVLVGIVIVAFIKPILEKNTAKYKSERKAEEEKRIRLETQQKLIAEQQQKNELAKQRAEEERKRKEEIERENTPFLYTQSGTPAYYPIIIIGKIPQLGTQKVIKDIDNRIVAKVEANELVEKGYPIVEIYGHNRERSKIVMWCKISNGIAVYDIRE